MGQERPDPDAGGRAGVQPQDHVTQPFLEVDAVVLAGRGETGQDRHAGPAVVAADEEPVLPPQAEGAHGVLAGVVVDVDLRVGQEAPQRVLLGDGVGGRPRGTPGTETALPK